MNINGIEKNILHLKKSYLDFFEYCKENSELIFKNSIKVISIKYGCGMSFIYNFLKKLDFKNWREFRMFLFYKVETNSKNEDYSIDKLRNILTSSIENTAKQFSDEVQQIDKFLNLLFMQNKQIFFCGLGYSLLPAYDLFSIKLYFPNLNWHFLREHNKSYAFEKEKYYYNDTVFVIFSLSGRSASNLKFIEEIKKLNPTIIIWLITGSTHYNPVNIDEVILIPNIMKMNDIFLNNIIVSPAFDMIIFNNLLKTRAYNLFKNIFIKSEAFNEEFSWWDNPKKIKDMGF